MVNEKCRQRISPWGNYTNYDICRGAIYVMFNSSVSIDIITQDAEKFSALFDQVTDLVLADNKDTDLNTRRIFLMFIINCYRSFENNVVRRECMR
jgi:hypothetical protein